MMADTFNWVMNKLYCHQEYDGYANVVYKVHWERTVSNEAGVTASIWGEDNLDVDNIVDFVPFENLTPAEVVDWVENALGPARLKEINDYLIQTLRTIESNSSLISEKPWEIDA